MARRARRLMVAGLLALTLALGASYGSSASLWPVLFDQISSGPGSGGNGGGGG